MIVALFTSRLVLQALGVEDFGLYNVIGGVVSLFAFLRTSLEQTTQRFLSYEMGTDNGRLSEVFRVNFTIHVVITIVAFLLSETIGLWFVDNYINVPSGRELATHCVYQSVVLSLCMTILTVPFSAAITAHEKMSYYAIVNIIDALLKLIIAYAILYDKNDRLILYGILMGIISVFNFALYSIYSKIKYDEVEFKLLFDRTLMKEVLGFTSWTLLGQAATLGTNQGNNVFVNIFHGVTSNAAMGVGNQIGSAILGLSGNFQKAFNPQITKSYAEKDFDYMCFLLFVMSKVTFGLMLLCSLPVIFNIDIILEIWLVIVPPGASTFAVLFIVQGIINALSTPLNFCINASGDIKRNQIILSVFYLSDLVILYFLFKTGFPPETAMWVKIYVVISILFVRLHYAIVNIPSLSMTNYCIKVLFPLIVTSTLCFILVVFLGFYSDSIKYRIVSSVFLIVSASIFLYFIMLTRDERKAVMKVLCKKK
ncbi:MAG: hypothetical protein J5875_13460 [Paludibacteraceae bacterium]|nr:hypothetical protein [Paludibacteraceae bacterium]